jgi:hypothetical protein
MYVANPNASTLPFTINILNEMLLMKCCSFIVLVHCVLGGGGVNYDPWT